MSASLNKHALIGNIGRSVELRFTPNGTPVATVSIATTNAYKGKDGERVEETDWHRVVFFGRLAEVAHQYLKVGSSIYVEGRSRTRSWDDKDGVTRYTTEVIAHEMQMLGTKPDAAGKTAAPPKDDAPAPGDEIGSDRVPF